MHTEFKRSAIDGSPQTNEDFNKFRTKLRNEYGINRARFLSDMDPNLFERLLFKNIIAP